MRRLPLLVCLAACSATHDSEEVAPDARDPRSVLAAIEGAHGRSPYAREALHADVRVEFGGGTLLDGRMVHDATRDRTRLELADGTVAVFDGDEAWVGGGELPRARFHLRTWSYFLVAPWKLDDPGTRLESLGSRALHGAPPVPAVRVAFEDGVGDSPDDWYVVYPAADSDRLRALGYIVTYGTSVAEALRDPHAALYEQYADVDGSLLPTRIDFYAWTLEGGVTGEPIGVARFSDLRFAPAPAGAFEEPPGARADPLPGS